MINQGDVTESFKGNKSLKKVSKRALANQDLAREYKRIDKRMSEGVKSIDIGKDLIDLGNGLRYVRGNHGCYIVKNNEAGEKDVVGIRYRTTPKNIKTLAEVINDLYNVNINPDAYK